MANLTEQEIIERYSLQPEKIEEIKQTIIRAIAKDYVPSKNPLAIIVGGQSGSGKTALINFTSAMSSKREFVQIDNDFFRAFHPQADDIKALYPDFYRAATDQLGIGITADVIEYFKNNNYNIILHQTLKSTRIADDAMTKFREAGYTVGVRAFAVPYFESKMSQIERCEEQINSLGFCRYVTPESHDEAIKGLPGTVGYIEDTGKYDFLEIYKRGELISQPVLVYSKLNPQTQERTLQTLSDCENVSHNSNTFGFTSAKEAVEKTRESEAAICAETLAQRIEDAEKHPSNNEEMQTHIDELKIRFEEYKLEHEVLPSRPQEEITFETNITLDQEDPLPKFDGLVPLADLSLKTNDYNNPQDVNQPVINLDKFDDPAQ